MEPSAFLKISALGVEEQRVNVLADFTSPFEQRTTLGDGYRLEASVVSAAAENVVKFPVGALFRTRGSWVRVSRRGWPCGLAAYRSRTIQRRRD